MTRDDLVQRLTHVAGELHDCPMCEPYVEAIEAAAVALAGRPAVAPPADLVALVREWQEAMRAYPKTADVAGLVDAQAALLAYPLPAAPRVPDTPQGCVPFAGSLHRCNRGTVGCYLHHHEAPTQPPQEPPR